MSGSCWSLLAPLPLRRRGGWPWRRSAQRRQCRAGHVLYSSVDSLCRVSLSIKTSTERDPGVDPCGFRTCPGRRDPGVDLRCWTDPWAPGIPAATARGWGRGVRIGDFLQSGIPYADSVLSRLIRRFFLWWLRVTAWRVGWRIVVVLRGVVLGVVVFSLLRGAVRYETRGRLVCGLSLSGARWSLWSVRSLPAASAPSSDSFLSLGGRTSPRRPCTLWTSRR